MFVARSLAGREHFGNNPAPIMIVSTTLTGSNADIIRDALASVVAQVDRCIVIDTGAKDDSLAIAREVAGEKLLVREFPWCNDFSAARNFALQAATEAGGRWAVTVDTDERLLFDPGVSLRDALSRTRAKVLLIGHRDGSYAKERIIRLPTSNWWNGPTHEALEGQRAGESEILQGVHFDELRKDAAAMKLKFERDVAILAEHVKQNPTLPRWHYYLGASLHDLRRHEEAIESFKTCAALKGWNEEGAWACYRAAECYCALKRWKEAIEMCGQGLAIRPATAELAWMAGWAAFNLRQYEDAIAWSNMAVVNGFHDGAGAGFSRISFRYPYALYEGPYETLKWTFERLGNHAAAKVAEKEVAAAKKRREGK
jgi:tetratricopeptide (TPR) repeat protein